MSDRNNPVRLQLSRKAGFRLFQASYRINQRDVINCARPGPFGNIYTVGLAACGCRSAGECPHNHFRVETAQEAVEAHRAWLRSWVPYLLRDKLATIRGRNVACWCPLDAPCHADTWLELAADQALDTELAR